MVSTRYSLVTYQMARLMTEEEKAILLEVWRNGLSDPRFLDWFEVQIIHMGSEDNLSLELACAPRPIHWVRDRLTNEEGCVTVTS
jgi:hypothetical protein